MLKGSLLQQNIYFGTFDKTRVSAFEPPADLGVRHFRRVTSGCPRSKKKYPLTGEIVLE
jgi:hypothetical protein